MKPLELVLADGSKLTVVPASAAAGAVKTGEIAPVEGRSSQLTSPLLHSLWV